MSRTQKNPYEAKFDSVTQSTVNYMNAKKQERAILDQALANKKAELEQRKREDKEFRRDAAKARHPHNFFARWKIRLNYRMTQHNMRKESLDEFVAGQKEAREEIESSLGRAMKNQTQFKEDYVKAVKKNDATWFEKADAMKTELDTNTREVVEANESALQRMRDEKEEKAAQEARSAALQKEIDRREEYEKSFYEEAPKKKSMEHQFEDMYSANRQTRGQTSRPAASKSRDEVYKGK